jgi:hypothetical protein
MLFDSAASIAANFPSTCGSLRRPPAASKQRIPATTPHVGQGTASNILAVKSLILIECRELSATTGEPQSPQRS